MIAITGATGQLGNYVIEHLLKKGVSPKTIIAIVRNKHKALKLANLGIDIREGDYNSYESLVRALNGVDKLLLVSSSEIGQRVPQHKNVIDAAKDSKIRFIAYTSILNANTSKMQLAQEHLATEELIKAAKIPYAILRNSWYIENYTDQLNNYLQYGSIAGSTQNGKISGATRSDYALAAATVLIHSPKENTIYELGGNAFTLTELAQIVSKRFDKKIEYHDIPANNYKEMLLSVGLPLPLAEIFSDSDVGISRGELYTDKTDLEALIGQPVTTIENVINK